MENYLLQHKIVAVKMGMEILIQQRMIFKSLVLHTYVYVCYTYVQNSIIYIYTYMLYMYISLPQHMCV